MEVNFIKNSTELDSAADSGSFAGVVTKKEKKKSKREALMQRVYASTSKKMPFLSIILRAPCGFRSSGARTARVTLFKISQSSRQAEGEAEPWSRLH